MNVLQEIKRGVVKATGSRRPENPSALLRNRKPLNYRFKDDGYIPNHPSWPFVIYKGVVRLPGVTRPGGNF